MCVSCWFFFRALSDCSSFATEAEFLTEWPGESEEFGWMENFVVNLAEVLPSRFSRVLFYPLRSRQHPEIKSSQVSVITSPSGGYLDALGQVVTKAWSPKGGILNFWSVAKGSVKEESFTDDKQIGFLHRKARLCTGELLRFWIKKASKLFFLNESMDRSQGPY